jgi:maleylpyruvate isomerase
VIDKARLESRYEYTPNPFGKDDGRHPLPPSFGHTVRPQADIEGCRVAHHLLRSVVAELGDAEVGRASKLPGWSVGHVLTHLARNAESMYRRIDAAVRSEVIDQYEGGSAGRAAEIEAGANRDAAALRDDAASWSIKLDDLFQSLPDEVWARPVRSGAGDEHPVKLLPFMRWWEVEVHLVDLGLTVRASDWTDGLVNKALPRLLAGLPGRADARELMAWLLGRGPAPELQPWR